MSSTRRGLLLMTASSLAVPAAGVLSQPVLARALGIDGRGQLAAGLAPAALVLSVATLGLPEALTYYVARYPGICRRASIGASAIAMVVGAVCLGLAVGVLPLLTSGDGQLGRLIVIGVLVTIPALATGVLRGTAVGLQMWKEVAIERVLSVLLRIGPLLFTWYLGILDVQIALLATTAAPVLSSVAYARIFWLPRTSPDVDEPSSIFMPMISFGSRVWIGSVTEILLGRIAQIMIAPLSSIIELGLYSVAVAISDVPLIVALAAQTTLYGVNSRSRDAFALTRAARVVLLVALVGCSVLALSVPLWLEPVFGSDFSGAVLPTLILLASAVICVPGLMAAVSLSSSERPGLRSSVLMGTLIVNVGLLLLLVPPLGVYGACLTSVVSNMVMTLSMLGVAQRVLSIPARSFISVGPAEVRIVIKELNTALRRIRRV